MVRLLVAYRGSAFHGFAEQRDVPTVAGAIRSVLEDLHGGAVTLVCAGRTDRGVHAWGQVVSYELGADASATGTPETAIDAAPKHGPVDEQVAGRAAGATESPTCDTERIQAAVNGRLGPDIVVRAAEIAPEGFDARRSALSRTYRYTIWNGPAPNPFMAETTWHVREPLDLSLLRLGCDPIIGEHDFSSFCRTPSPGPDGEPRSLVRRVIDAAWHQLDSETLRFEITASAFCHQMVRSVTGTLVDMGRGRLRPGEMAGILRARDRQAASNLAPPEGLCLWHVDYGGLGFADPASAA